MSVGNKLLIGPFISFLAHLPGPNAGKDQNRGWLLWDHRRELAGALRNNVLGKKILLLFNLGSQTSSLLQ